MSSEGSRKSALHFLNGLYLVLGLGVAAVALWFYVQLYAITRLRNPNHYLLDYKVYWPQAIPWIYLIICAFVISTAIIGFVGARKGRRQLLVLYIGLSVFTTVLLLLAAIVTLVFADSKMSDNFLQDTISDAFQNARTDLGVEQAFGLIEKRLQCCGAHEPRDYKSYKSEFPQSCCDVYYRGFLDTYIVNCEFSDKLANERLGCSVVAKLYARIVYRALAGFGILLTLIGILGTVVAVSLSKILKKKSRVLAAQIGAESKKNLL